MSEACRDCKCSCPMGWIAGVVILGAGAWTIFQFAQKETVPPTTELRASLTTEEQKEFDKAQAEKAKLIERTPTSGQ